MVVDQARKWCPVGYRHAEQFADDRDRQREGERGEQVHLALSRHAVEQVGRDGGDPRPERLDPARGEGLAHQPAQSIVIGRVQVEHVHMDGGEVGILVRPPALRHLHQPGIGQRGARLRVPRDQPRGHAARHDDPRDRVLGPQSRVYREGIGKVFGPEMFDHHVHLRHTLILVVRSGEIPGRLV